MSGTQNKIIIYTDGSSRGNPGPGGWGAIIATDSRVVELGSGDAHTTNNKMELTAAIEALALVREMGDAYTIEMCVDSQYVINGITKWVAGWERNGWINSKKEQVLNRDLWEALAQVVSDLQLSGCKILWKYAPGHVGIEGNERADVIATEFADENAPELFDGPRDEYEVDLVLHEGRPELVAAKKSKSKTKSGVKAYSYLSLVGGKLEKHATWAECEKRVKGTKAARFKKAVSAEDEQKILREWGV